MALAEKLVNYQLKAKNVTEAFIAAIIAITIYVLNMNYKAIHMISSHETVRVLIVLIGRALKPCLFVLSILFIRNIIFFLGVTCDFG